LGAAATGRRDRPLRCPQYRFRNDPARLWPTGQRPGSTIEVSNVDDWYSAIAAGDAIGITPASTAEIYPHPDVRYVPLVDAPPVWIYLAWPAASAHPAIATLLSIIHSIIQPERGT
jgi:DNA-binding transcriptional LysR family regulator